MLAWGLISFAQLHLQNSTLIFKLIRLAIWVQVTMGDEGGSEYFDGVGYGEGLGEMTIVNIH